MHKNWHLCKNVIISYIICEKNKYLFYIKKINRQIIFNHFLSYQKSTSFFESFWRGQNRSAFSFLGICFLISFCSYIERPWWVWSPSISLTISVASNCIIKRRETKSRSPCTFLSTLRYIREAATRRLILSHRERWSSARQQKKRERERERYLNEWRGIDTRNIGYTTENASTILLSPFCLLLFIPTLLPRPTWSTGLRTACVHARINKRSIHYL